MVTTMPDPASLKKGANAWLSFEILGAKGILLGDQEEGGGRGRQERELHLFLCGHNRDGHLVGVVSASLEDS